MRKCEVLVNGKKAGMLSEVDNPRKYIFQYYKEYIVAETDPVCIAMPVREQPYVSNVLFPYFFNMLSEGENRLIQASQLHIDKDDDFGILMATAKYDTVGVVTVKPVDDK